jgi:hypothetical protein
LEQLYTFGNVGRDPRNRVVSIAYLGLVNPSYHELFADSDAEDAQWFSVNQLPKLAFDHQTIIDLALKDFVPKSSISRSVSIFSMKNSLFLILKIFIKPLSEKKLTAVISVKKL